MKTIIIITVVMGVIIGGTVFKANTHEADNVEVAPVVELTTEQKFEEARNQMLKEIETLEAEKVALEEKIKAKKELIKWREDVATPKKSVATPIARNEIEKLIVEAFPEEPHRALAIAKCESNLNPKAYNPNNSDGSTDGGLWQINSVHDKSLNRLGLDKFDPHDATKYARMLYEQNGWRDWVCARKIAMR